MGQKVHPVSMRLQLNKSWRSRWFASKREYSKFLTQDLAVRRLIENKNGTRSAINRIDIERSPNLVTVTIQTAKAGVVMVRAAKAHKNSRPTLKRSLKHLLGSTSKSLKSLRCTLSLLPRTLRLSLNVVSLSGEQSSSLPHQQ